MADTRITDAEIAGYMGWRGPGAYTEASLRKIRQIVDHAVRAERAAANETKKEELRDVFDLGWSQALSDAAFYVEGHCADGAHHVEHILELVQPKMTVDGLALASRPAEVDDKIPRESNDALIAMAKYWKLDGDWMTCKGCRRSLIASRDGEELAHGEGCKYWNQQHPWAQLRELIARRPAPAGIAQ
jgi:hypothetical protein